MNKQFVIIKIRQYVFRKDILNNCSVGIIGIFSIILLTFQTGVCRIGGVCYAEGFVNPEKAEESCRTLVSTTAWTVVKCESYIFSLSPV